MNAMDTMTSVMTMATATNSAMPTSTPAKGGMSDMGSMDMSCKISMLWNWYTINSCFISHSWKITSRGMFAGSCIGVILLVVVLEALRRLGREYDHFILRRARLRYLYLSGPSSRSISSGTSGVENQTPPHPGTNGKSAQGKHGLQSSSEQDPIAPVLESSLSTKTPHESHQGVSASMGTGVNGTQSNADRAEFGPYRPSIVEQLVRALLHTVQFAVAYFIMLLAMYYNGYFIICIFIGAFIGSLVFSWEPVSLSKENDATTVTKCCG